MKYFSELTNKTYDTAEECSAAEKSFLEEEAKKKELALVTSKEKKELAKVIEAADEALNAEYEKYDEAKKKVEEIYRKAQEEANSILSESRKRVAEAEKNKYKAISDFNAKFGVYNKSYTGDAALRELERANRWINHIFDGMFF